MEIKLVPEGYTQLEYIEQPLGNSGYIRTGINASNTIEFTIEFETHDSINTSATTNAFGVIFGARYTKANAFLLGTYRTTAGGEFKTGNSAVNPHIVKNTKIKCSLSGNTYQNGEFTETVTRNASHFQEIYLFCNNTAGTAEEFGHYKLYSLKFIDNGVTLRHFIPCINPDSIVGLYDRITKGFFTSANDVTFTAGPVKTITLTAIAKKAIEVNYIKEDLRSAINEHYGTEELVYSDGLVEYANAIDNIDTSNYTLPTEPKAVNFIDYDGTLLYAYTASEFQAMEGLPRNPWHSGLIAQGWNWTREEILDYLTRAERIDISQNYITDDGATRLYIHKERLRTQYIYINQSASEGVEIDWGDSSEFSKITGTGEKIFSHNYTSIGDYCIRLIPKRGTYHLTTKPAQSANNFGYPTIFGPYSTVGESLLQELYKVEIGNNIPYLGGNCLWRAFNLKTVTIPTSIESLRYWCFFYCSKLKHISIPPNCMLIRSCMELCVSIRYIALPPNFTFASGSTACFKDLRRADYILIHDGIEVLPGDIFYNWFNLKSIYLSKNLTTIPANCFRSCVALKTLVLPATVNNIGATTNVGANQYSFGACWSLIKLVVPEGPAIWPGYTCQDCYSMAVLDLPSTITAVGNNSIRCWDLRRLIIRATVPPTLSGANISQLSSSSHIYVPYSEDHSILEAYKTATNWSTYASYMTELNPDGTIPT